jgi:hypothetical protein
MIDPQEGQFIEKAFEFLEHPSFLLRLANAVGRPIELALESLPTKHQDIVHRASEAALKKGLAVMTGTIPKKTLNKSFAEVARVSRTKGRLHSLATFGLGAAGGFFGILSLPLELPMTTAVMLRSIASIASEFGMDLDDPQVQLECLYILSLGARPSDPDGAMNSAYWTSRTVFAKTVGEAVSFMAGKSAVEIMRGLETRSAPMLVKFVATIASRFELVVSEKLAAEAIPIIGAVGGGIINAAFTDYFSEAARYHFGLRALENRHGRKTVEDYYNSKVRVS